MFQGAAVALRTHLATLRAARAGRLFLWGIAAVLLVVLGGYAVGLISRSSLEDLRQYALLPGVPILAVLVSEVPIRDGIANRTLLYLLLAPVSRTTLALTRTAVAAGLLAAGAGVFVLALGIVGGANMSQLLRELLAVALGSLAYVSLFGLLHLWTKRGLFAGLVLYVILDWPIGRLPFALRNVAPSAHVRTVADLSATSDLAVSLPVAEPPTLVSVGVLLGLTVVAALATALRFSRRDLGELC